MKLLSTLSAGLLCAGLLLAAAACSGNTEASFQSSSTSYAVEEINSRPFLELIPGSMQNNAFLGERRITTRTEFDGVAFDLVYRERVVSDGQGRFSIEPLEVIEPANMAPDDMQWFLITQKEREVFFYRYRDFGIDDMETFLVNYEVFSVGEATIFGRQAIELDVRRHDDPQRSYRIAVDTPTGIVLRSREYALDGTLVYSMEFESLTMNPILAGQDLIAHKFQHTALDPDAPAASTRQTLGFTLMRPSLLPQGYQLREAMRLDPAHPSLVDEDPWARIVYSDGVERVFFMHQPYQPDGHFNRPDRLRHLTVGEWTIVEGQVGSQRIACLGKVSADELLLLVQSALE